MRTEHIAEIIIVKVLNVKRFMHLKSMIYHGYLYFLMCKNSHLTFLSQEYEHKITHCDGTLSIKSNFRLTDCQTCCI